MVKSTVKTPERILALISQDPSITVSEISEFLELSKSAIEKQISKLKQTNKLTRSGPDKGGHWEII